MNKLARAKSIARVFWLALLRSAKTLFWTKFFVKHIYLKSWFGELGNNLIQIAQAVFLSKKLDIPFSLPKHSFLTVEDYFLTHDLALIESANVVTSTSDLLLSDLQGEVKNISSLNHFLLRSFFYNYDIFPLFPGSKDYRDILRNQVLSLIPHQLDESITEKTLVIHMRSGDAFKERFVHNAYIQPPLSFYIKIIEAFNFEEVVIVTQPDLKNPCIHQLKELYPNVRIQASSLLEDVSTILSAKNLVIGLSTFSLGLGFSSQQIEKLFIPQFEVSPKYWRTLFWSSIFKLFIASHPLDRHIHQLDFQICLARISNYIAIGDWRNTPKQRELMLQHSQEDIAILNDS